MEVEARRAVGFRGLAAVIARGGELSAEEAASQGYARHCRAEGSESKTMLTIGANRPAVIHARGHQGLSEPKKQWEACALIAVIHQ